MLSTEQVPATAPRDRELSPRAIHMMTSAALTVALSVTSAGGRVEMWRGGLGCGLFSLLARPFVCECHNIATMLRFHIPLIEPDVRISRIRLSDWLHRPAHDGSVSSRAWLRKHHHLRWL